MVGSITSLGLGSGIQLQDIIDQMREADEAPLERLRTQKSRLGEQISAFDQLNLDLLGIKSQALTLSLQSTFISRSVTISDDSVVSATVTDGAATGSHRMTVNRLATESSWQGTGMSAESGMVNDTGGDETFSYKVGDGDTISITVSDQTTLLGLAALINADENNPGVTASVINDGDPENPYRLVLQADETGEDSRITIESQLSGYTLSEVQGADAASLNAEIVVDSITYQRGSNTAITDILGGVTLHLLDTGTSSVSVAADHTTLREAIVSMVEGVNSVLQGLDEQTGYDEEGGLGLLSDVGTARTLGRELINLLSTTVETDGTIQSLYDLGFEVNRDGTISLDETLLDEALADNFDAVQTFFLGDDDTTVTGFADQVNDRLRVMTRPLTGTMASERTAAEERIDRIDSQIETATARLDKRYEILARQFAELDRFMNEMESMSTFLTSQFDAISGQKE
jgi:flagellar hook-associated protein 2